MRKIMCMVLLFVLLTNMFAITVVLDDNNSIECEIAGKQNGSLFLYYDGIVYRVSQSNIKSILVNGADFKSIEFRRNDWVIDTIDTTKIVDYSPARIDLKADIKSGSLKPFETMSEREFQVYLAQMNANVQKENNTKLQKTIWSSSIVCLVLGMATYSVVNYNSKSYRWK